MYRYASLIFFTVFAFSLSVKSQEIWNLPKCIQFALDKNIQLKQVSLNEEALKFDITKAKADYQPTLNANSNVYTVNNYKGLASQKRTTDKISDLKIELSYTLFNGMKRYFSLQKAKLGYKKASLETEKMEFDISISVFMAYLQVLLDEEQSEITKQMLEISQKQLNQIIKLHDAGMVTKLKVLNIQSQLATDQLQLLKNESTLKTSYVNLFQLLNINTTDSFRIEKPAIEINDSTELDSFDYFYNKALKNLSQVKIADLQLESTNFDIKISKSTFSPNIVVNGSLYSSYIFDSMKSFKKQVFDYNYNPYLGLTINVPIFNNANIKTSIAKSQIAYKDAQLNVELVRQQVHKDMINVYTSAEIAFNIYIASLTTLKTIAENFNFVQKQFDAGLTTAIEFDDAKTKYSKALAENVMYKYEYFFKREILNLYSGEKIFALQ